MHMSRALALAVLLLAAAAVAPPPASAQGAEHVPGARVLAGVGADPEPEHALGMTADPAPDARP
ncbi:hypothetical protein PVAP13_2KG403900 [Panicum virgatum]|uniref:Uncharacterized protein n=1 Tax=Panicum virgatum TaxID=38727 RepID=A0A8T0WA77_PANVG|nr:hypothetical protein PVAP13_2KG403900 [Panicum virgatum]